MTKVSLKANLPLKKATPTKNNPKGIKLGFENVGNICLEYGFNFNDLQLRKIVNYISLLQKWNRAMNLVGKNSWYDILVHLVLDSFFLEKYLKNHTKLNYFENIWDLGSGAGLPGIPLRILWEQGTYSLVEAREKRCLFLQMALASLELPNTKIFQTRAEDFMQKNQEAGCFANLIISRAFMPYEKMLPFIQPYLQKQDSDSPSASVLFLSLERLQVELESLKNWKVVQVYDYKVQNKTKFISELELIGRC